MFETTTPQADVALLTAHALDALFTSASLHLGEANVRDERLRECDPKEAWLALYAAGSLLDRISPLLSEDVLVPYRASFTRLGQLFAERHEDFAIFESPRETPVSSLVDLANAMVAELEAPEEPMTRAAGTGPFSLPGSGLPQKGSSPLFPR
jgi:hypothetical protein